MADEVTEVAACVHACMQGCGRPIDVYVIQVVDLSTLGMCIPCFQQFAYQMTRAMIEPDSADIQEVVQGADFSDIAFLSPNAVGYSVNVPVPVPAEDEFAFDGMDES